MRLKVFRRYDVMLLALTVALVSLYVLAAGGGFPLDDSWIHQVYGRNLAHRGQWAFVEGQPSAASTSPLYTVLLAIGYSLNLPYQLWTHLLGAVALFVTAVVGARMAERLLPERRWVGAGTGLALVLAWHLVWAAVSGMETMLFSMFTIVLIVLAWREVDALSTQPARLALRGFGFGILAALATLARPEGVVLAGIIGLVMLLVRPQGMIGVIMWGLCAAVGFLLAIAPYLILNYQLTGGLLPDTAAAKQAQAALWLAVSYPRRVVEMVIPLLAGGQVLLVPGIISMVVAILRRVRTNRQEIIHLLPLLWTLALILLYAARLPAPYQHGRYVIPALPSLIIMGVVGSFWLVHAARLSLVGRVITRGLAISTLLLFVVFAFGIGVTTYVRDVAIIDEEMVTTAMWIRENIPEDDLLAIHDIGAVGYFAPRPILDITGLVNPEVIPLLLNEEALWYLMETRGAHYLMAFPDQIPGGDVNDERLCPVFVTNNPTAVAAGGQNMRVYRLAWNGDCAE